MDQTGITSETEQRTIQGAVDKPSQRKSPRPTLARGIDVPGAVRQSAGPRDPSIYDM